MRVRVIGDKTGLDEDIRNRIDELEKASAHNDGLNFQIAINYGSRDEMVRAMRKMAADRDAGKLGMEDITEETFSSYLDTAEIPDPDLLIRTSGEERLSNFLLWQLAYTCLLYTSEYFLEYLARQLRVEKEDILDYELGLYNTDTGDFLGMSEEFISSPRLDNLTSVQAVVTALIEGGRDRGVNLAAFFDHEEIGSTMCIRDRSTEAQYSLRKRDVC